MSFELIATHGPKRKTQILQKKRDTIVSGLDSIPNINCDVPSGAFYAFPDITETVLTSQEFTNKLMETVDVAVVSGTAFGTLGEGYVRVTYATSDEEIDEGLKRLEEASLIL